MTWEVRWTPRALKDLRKRDPQIRRRVVEAVNRFAGSGSGDVLQLTGIQPPEWRLRVGDWRVRFRKEPSASVLVLLRVLPRDKAYRSMAA